MTKRSEYLNERLKVDPLYQSSKKWANLKLKHKKKIKKQELGLLYRLLHPYD